ncbi:hypothetical protein [Paraburkholderia youngii]|uniref:hypothetical protein n=1 Tax=Paraburkholderia youngii TaxID=2782701 RepID=UPI001FEB6022|nr:hypothetical protein [Paraburkholderia youngii]
MNTAAERNTFHRVMIASAGGTGLALARMSPGSSSPRMRAFVSSTATSTRLTAAAYARHAASGQCGRALLSAAGARHAR